MTPNLGEDIRTYEEIQAELRRLIEASLANGPEFQAKWAESERIKNRHGGMPPNYTQGKHD